jgi:hypothetical protein
MKTKKSKLRYRATDDAALDFKKVRLNKQENITSNKVDKIYPFDVIKEELTREKTDSMYAHKDFGNLTYDEITTINHMVVNFGGSGRSRNERDRSIERDRSNEREKAYISSCYESLLSDDKEQRDTVPRGLTESQLEVLLHKIEAEVPGLNAKDPGWYKRVLARPFTDGPDGPACPAIPESHARRKMWGIFR